MASDSESAAVELHRYFSGLIPPLRAAELFDRFVALPPERIVAEMQSWVEAQRQANPAMPASDFLFHALRKLHLIGELGVVDASRVDAFFDWLLPLAVESSPHDERPRLRLRIAAMTHRVAVVPTFSGNVVLPSPAPPPIASDTPSALPADHFALVLERVTAERAAGVTLPPADALATVEQLVLLAAMAASTRDELRDLMRRIPALVPPSQIGNAFHLLGGSIPAWEVALSAEEKAACVPGSIRAMHRIVSLSSDELERAKRLRELILAAVEQFNGGSLFAAGMMLELARTVIAEPGLARTVVERICGEAAGSLDATRMRNYVADRRRHALLRDVLGFFPSLRTDHLLMELRGERRPERRRALLAVLEAWGPVAREAALACLRKELEFGPAADTWFLRNTVFLLHRIPRESDDTIDEELEILRYASSREQVIYVVKEAIVAIGTIRTAAAARLLIERLSDLENVAMRGDQGRGPLPETIKAIDRTIASLARIGTSEALRRAVVHGLRTEPMLGDTRGRLAPLAQVDLSSSPDAIELLVSAIRAELPGVLGRVMGKAANTTPLIQALSSTDAPPVRTLLEELASRQAKSDIGAAAAAVLGQLAATRAEPAGKAKEGGELRPFGLAELVQSLGESKATGILSVADGSRRLRGRLVFSSGRILEAESGTLRDDEGFFDLLEHPDAGWYSFTPLETTDGHLRADVGPLLVEGLRRHDQLMRTRVLAPDRAVFRHKGPRPTPHSEEKDPALMKEVWRCAVSGRPVKAWEGELAADAFRVRRLLAHWLGEGSMEEVFGRRAG